MSGDIYPSDVPSCILVRHHTDGPARSRGAPLDFFIRRIVVDNAVFGDFRDHVTTAEETGASRHAVGVDIDAPT